MLPFKTLTYTATQQSNVIVTVSTQREQGTPPQHTMSWHRAPHTIIMLIFEQRPQDYGGAAQFGSLA